MHLPVELYENKRKGIAFLSFRGFPRARTLSTLLSTDWFQERIRAWFHNRTWVPYGRL